MANNAACWFAYAIPYLMLQPAYKCAGMQSGDGNFEIQCKPEYFCHNEIQWEVDWDNKYSLHNWMTKYELHCENSFMISGPGLTLLFGFALGVIILPKWSEPKGRKNYFLMFLFC